MRSWFSLECRCWQWARGPQCASLRTGWAQPQISHVTVGQGLPLSEPQFSVCEYLFSPLTMGITLLWDSSSLSFIHALLQWVFIECLQYARGSAVPGPPRPVSVICNKCRSWRILGTPTFAGKVGCSSRGMCGAWVPPGGRTGKRWSRRWVTCSRDGPMRLYLLLYSRFAYRRLLSSLLRVYIRDIAFPIS